MIDVQPGQFVIVQGRYGYSATRADQITAKQIRTLRHGSSYSQERRDSVIFAGTKEQVAQAIEALDEARRARQRAHREADEAFRIATAPAARVRDDAKLAANATERDAVLRIVASPNSEVSHD